MFCCCFGIVHEKQVAVLENCGQFSRVANPGCVCVNVQWCESIRAVVSMKIEQLTIVCDTKTKDNVFVKVAVAVQYQIIPGKVDIAYYKLTDHKGQIK